MATRNEIRVLYALQSGEKSNKEICNYYGRENLSDFFYTLNRLVWKYEIELIDTGKKENTYRITDIGRKRLELEGLRKQKQDETKL